MKYNKKALSLIFFLILMTFTFSTCSKSDKSGLSDDQNNETSDKNTEVSIIEENDLSESDEDLTTVDYKDFYDLLSPHGEWMEIKTEEIGLPPNTAGSDFSKKDFLSLSDIIGVRKVNAAVVNAELVFVWKPSPELGVTLVNEETPEFIPYTNGQWIYTDAGWYFKAPTPAEETVSHYGRWVNTPSAGWLWVPGRVWSPAWVDWKEDEIYLSWAPLPPSVYVINNKVSVPVIEERNYVVVEKKYFLEPQVYKYTTVYSKTPVRDLTRIENIVVTDNVIINKGPAITFFETLFGSVISPVKIVTVHNLNEVRYTDREYIVYKPVFKKYKHRGNKRITIKEPKSYKKYDEWKVLKSAEKELKKDEKELRKEVKEISKDIQKKEIEIKKDIQKKENEIRKDIQKKEKEIKKDIRKNNYGNKKDNGNKEKINKGNDKGYSNKNNKNKSNDNGKGKK